MRVVPQRRYKSTADEEAQQISSKLQYRYVGPYMIHEVLMPVLYSAMIHGKLVTVHAINIKPACRDQLTLAEQKRKVLEDIERHERLRGIAARAAEDSGTSDEDEDEVNVPPEAPREQLSQGVQGSQDLRENTQPDEDEDDYDED